MILKLLFILVITSKKSKLQGPLILLDLQVTRYRSYLSNEVVEHALTDFTSKKVQIFLQSTNFKIHSDHSSHELNQQSKPTQTRSYRSR